MKKQASDQQFHDRRHQERQRAEAAKKLPQKKAADAAPAAVPAADQVAPAGPVSKKSRG
jgi:hypothetical protein